MKTANESKNNIEAFIYQSSRRFPSISHHFNRF